MPRAFERNATASGFARACAARSAGAFVLLSAAASISLHPPAGRGRAVQDQARELGRDALDRRIRLLSEPRRRGVAHAEQRERREPGIQIRAELAPAHALLEHALDDPLEAPRAPAHAPAARVGEM